MLFIFVLHTRPYDWLMGCWNNVNSGGGGDGGGDNCDDGGGGCGIRSFVCSIFTAFNFRTLYIFAVCYCYHSVHSIDCCSGFIFPLSVIWNYKCVTDIQFRLDFLSLLLFQSPSTARIKCIFDKQQQKNPEQQMIFDSNALFHFTYEKLVFKLFFFLVPLFFICCSLSFLLVMVLTTNEFFLAQHKTAKRFLKGKKVKSKKKRGEIH